MHIILTHEQADFDALASMLGAQLLHEGSIPVLPRRINRNVRAFLTLYGMEFPFVDPRDFIAENIKIVTLVDTQSMVSIKGIDPDIKVQIIDHHLKKKNLPEGWIVKTVETGATTTLLVEELQEQNGIISAIQATLMLLGIYEDTGSLTYSRTTKRDMLAAAFLLEKGADLQIVSRFLNLPLSQGQQQLFHQLCDTAKNYNVAGFSIIVACGDAKDLDEELSSIAHKMQDLLDPDALFLLATTRGGIQIIARSTVDNINVSKILADYGGGGHDRAAACLVRDRELTELCVELVHKFKNKIRPSLSVSEIMSLEPQLLSPDTPVISAADRMKRFGYEGFPVVSNGKVIGLLTRRAVDRALAHNLILTVDKLMEAGNYTVYPEDSVETLKDLMTETGWGQIPVVHHDSDRIIGIVTRTDLLKTLRIKSDFEEKLNLSSRLEEFLPQNVLDLLKKIAREAQLQQTAIYLVGGFVRDLILGYENLDFDLVVEGDAISFTKSLSSKFGGRVTSHTRFGTAKWHLFDGSFDQIEQQMPERSEPESLSIDFVSARTEFYTYPTALPTVERGSIKLDLHRRDFTINTLALRMDGQHFGELYDYWGGLKDLHEGKVRVLHSLSFVDDPTRILRAVRFEKKFNFQIEPRTLELLKGAISLLDRLSGDRLRHELDNIFEESNSDRIMERLQELSLLNNIYPSLDCNESCIYTLKKIQSLEPEQIWETLNFVELKRYLSYIALTIRLPERDVKQIIKRLRCPAELEKILLETNSIWEKRISFIDARPSEVVEYFNNFQLISLFGFYLIVSDDEIKETVINYVDNWRFISTKVDGWDLIERGISPGPVYRQILNNLKKARINGDISSDEEEMQLLEQILASLPKNSSAVSEN